MISFKICFVALVRFLYSAAFHLHSIREFDDKLMKFIFPGLFVGFLKIFSYFQC